MERNGFIKLHRTLLDNPISKKPQYAWLWTVLLLMANHKPNKFMWNGEIIIIKEGQLITGRKQLSQKTGIPESTIERILKFLENEHQIGQQKTNKFRLITIINWGKYQQRRTAERTTSGQQADTNKNDKNEKKNTVSKADGEKFTSKKYISQMVKDKQKHIRIIGWYFQATLMEFPSLKAIQKEIGRHLKDASVLVEYTDQKVAKAVNYVKKKFPDEWNLGTVLKYINKI